MAYKKDFQRYHIERYKKKNAYFKFVSEFVYEILMHTREAMKIIHCQVGTFMTVTLSKGVVLLKFEKKEGFQFLFWNWLCPNKCKCGLSSFNIFRMFLPLVSPKRYLRIIALPPLFFSRDIHPKRSFFSISLIS